MPRQKLSEYRAKSIIYDALGQEYQGWSIQAGETKTLQNIPDDGRYVVKVDQAVKGRFKKGLVKLNLAKHDIEAAISKFSDLGYDWFIVEPQYDHDQTSERYISLAQTKHGLILQYTSAGGVDVESNVYTMSKVVIKEQTDWQNIADSTLIETAKLKKIAELFRDNYFVFLELNPYIVASQQLVLLDAAAEVDDAAMFFVDNWHKQDIRQFASKKPTKQEKFIEELDENSPASLKLSVLNPDGSVFLLLSGGGASVLVADEVFNQGYGEMLANYGEYSGNPNSEETYLYTREILQLLIRSKAPHKVLFIGGAVANFTDVAKTFGGIIRAIDEVAEELKNCRLKVYVRRGGPNQEKGLKMIQQALEKHGILGAVHDPTTSLTAAITEALAAVERA